MLKVNSDVFLHIILANILSNALKFSPPGGEVALTAISDAGKAEISVVNRAEKQHRENLVRISKGARGVESRAGTGSETGQGIGSSIVRRFCRLHGIGFSINIGEESSGNYLDVTSRLSVPLAACSELSSGLPHSETVANAELPTPAVD